MIKYFEYQEDLLIETIILLVFKLLGLHFFYDTKI